VDQRTAGIGNTCPKMAFNALEKRFVAAASRIAIQHALMLADQKSLSRMLELARKTARTGDL
jgi:hypothetical protein